jgi:rhodanese-related sulfurtransferase
MDRSEHMANTAPSHQDGPPARAGTVEVPSGVPVNGVPTGDDSAIARHLAETRAGFRRIEPSGLDNAIRSGALVVDIRPEANRRVEGELAGAVVIERIHLERWLDPTSPHRIPEAAPGRPVVVVCNEGYSSSLAAASLLALGVDGATDLVGGYRALRDIGSALALPPENG